MAAEIGWAGLGIVPQVDGDFYRQLGRDIDPALARVGRSSGSRFGGILGKAAAAGAAGAIGAGFAAFQLGKDAVDQASTLNESLNAVNVTYRKQADDVKALGQVSAETLGLSNAEFNSLAVRFSAFSKTIAGSDGEKVVTTLDDLTTRAADFASVMNLEVNEAAELFQSGLAGETEPLRRYGLDLSAAAVQAHALKTGIADGTGELTEAEKVQARYSLLMQQTAAAQGDFANTSDSLANRQRILNARWDDARAKLGTALLPIIEDATGFLLEKGIPAFEDFSDWFSEDGVDGLKRFGGFIEDDVIPIVKDLAGFLKDAAEFGGDVVGFINELPDSAKLTALAGVLGGVGALKLRGGRGGALGTAGAALGLAKPVPVVIVKDLSRDLGPDDPGGKSSKVPAWLASLGFAAQGGIGLQLSNEALEDQVGTKNAVSIAAAKSLPGSGGLSLPMTIDVPDDDEKKKVVDSFRDVFTQAADAFKEADIPTELRTHIAMFGVPETMREVRTLVNEYDLVPATKQTLLELAGFDRSMERLQRLNAELDWVTRPREARIQITKNYAEAGYQTYGGLQEGNTNDSSRRRNLGGFD